MNAPPRTASTCPGCGGPGGGTLVETPGGAAAAECSAAFGDLLAASYADPARRRDHQLLVDSFVAQHSGGTDPKQIQAVALCLMTLGLFAKLGRDPADGPALHRRMVERARLSDGPIFARLTPPSFDGTLTVLDLAADRGADYDERLREWAATVWECWEPQHGIVYDWIDRLGIR